jgi:predicted Zn-dependent protease
MIGVIGILKNQELFANEKARTEGKQPQAYHGLFASHPRNDQRLQEVIAAAEKFRDASQPVPDDGRFLSLTNGMAFGESESQGITRGNKFYHKSLNMYLEFPEGWKIVNQPSELIGVSSDRSQAIRMRMTAKTPGISPSSYLSSNFQNFRDGREISTAFGQAYAGVATLSDKKSGQSQNIRVSAIYLDDQAFVLLAQGKAALPNQSYFSVLKSMRGLKKNEIDLATGRNIKLIIAKEGDTFVKLAKLSKLPEYAEAQLRLINNMYPSGEPTVGQQIKIIK